MDNPRLASSSSRASKFDLRGIPLIARRHVGQDANKKGRLTLSQAAF